MVEVRRRVPKKEPRTLQSPLLTEVLETTYLNANQKRAREIIDTLDLSQDEKDLLFIFHLWHESGSLSIVRKLTGTNNNVDARKRLGEVSDSDELVKQYESFYAQYKLGEPEQD